MKEKTNPTLRFILLFAILIGSVENMHSQSDVSVANAERYFHTAKSYYNSENYDSAAANFQKASYLFKKLYEKQANQQFISYYLYCVDLQTFSYYQLNQYEPIAKLIEKTVNWTDTIIPWHNKFYGNLFETKAKVLLKQGNKSKAKKYYLKCLDVRKSLNGGDKQSLLPIYFNIAQIYFHEGKYDKAITYFNQSMSKSNFPEDLKDDISTLNYIGIAYLKKADYKNAEKSLKKSMKMSEGVDIAQHAMLTKSYKYLGKLYSEKGNLQQAEIFFQKALNLLNSIDDTSKIRRIKCYRDLAGVQSHLGKYMVAQTNLMEAIELLKSADQTNWALKGDLNKEIGNVFKEQGAYEKALQYYTQTLDIYKNKKHNAPKELIITQSALSDYWAERGNPRKAIDLLKESLDVYDDFYSENRIIQAKILGNLGKSYLINREYDKAFKTIKKSIKLYKSNCSAQEHPDIAVAYNNLGNVYNRKGNYSKAIESYEKSLKILHNIYGNNSHKLVSTYNNFGNVYAAKNEYKRAREFYLKALSLTKKHLGTSHPSLIKLYNNIGNLHLHTNEKSLSRSYHQKALKLKENIYGTDYPGLADSYNNLGNACLSVEAYDLAYAYFQKAIVLNKANYNRFHENIARGYGNIGNLKRKQKKYSEAQENLKKSLKIFRKTLGWKHPDVANTYINLGHVAFDRANYKSAISYYHKGIIANDKKASDTTHVFSLPEPQKVMGLRLLLDALLNKGDALRKLSKTESSDKSLHFKNVALEHFIMADSLISEIRKGIYSSKDKLNLGVKAYKVYSSALSLCIGKVKRAENDEKRKEFVRKAFYFSEKNKSRVLLQSIAESKAMKFAGIPEDKLKKEKTLKTKIGHYQEKIAKAEDEKITEEVRSDLFDLKREYENLIASFEKNYPGYYKLKHSSKNISVDGLQDMLNKNQAVISYFVGDSSVSIFLISKNNVKIESKCKFARFSDTLKYFRWALMYKNSKRFQRHYRHLGNKLYHYLIPQSIPSDVDELLIIPDAGLNTIPFGALLSERVKHGNENFRDYPYLLKKYKTSYSYSATLYSEIKERKKNATLNNGYDLLAMAPVFSNKEKDGITISSRRAGDSHKKIVKSDGEYRKKVEGEYISSLPGTEDEVISIYQEFKKNKKLAIVKLHSVASENFFKTTNLNNFDIIHLATHGIVNSEDPAKSGIIFADNNEYPDDGVLHTNEIYNLSIRTNLINLSACETGLGKIARGEGIIGLSRALLYAGAQNLIVSLWKVSDQSTKELMIQFYKNVIRNSDYQMYKYPLRDAKLDLIKNEKYAHPFYWAVFILIGS